MLSTSHVGSDGNIENQFEGLHIPPYSTHLMRLNNLKRIRSDKHLNPENKVYCPGWLDTVYTAAFLCYSQTGESFHVIDGRVLPPRPKLIEDFMKVYKKDPESEKSKTLGLYAEEFIFLDINARLNSIPALSKNRN